MVTIIMAKQRRTLESLFAKVEHQTSKDIASSIPGQHSFLQYNVVGQSERNWTNPLCRRVEEVDCAVWGALNAGDTQIEGLCSGSEEAFLKELTCAEELDGWLSSVAGLLVRRPVGSLTVCAAVASRGKVVACSISAVCATSTESAGRFVANDAGFAWCTRRVHGWKWC